MTEKEIHDLINRLALIPLEEEGGLVRETYASPFPAGEEAPDSERCGTAIYYMLRGKAFSHMHQLSGDEMYHFYLGDPVELLELFPDGTWKTTILGQDLAAGQEVQHLVKAGTWQGSRLVEGGSGALLATTNWPGYTPESYTHGHAEELIKKYPDAAELIRALTGTVSY